MLHQTYNFIIIVPGIVLDKWYQLIEEGMHKLMTPIEKLCEFGYTHLLPGVEIIP